MHLFHCLKKKRKKESDHILSRLLSFSRPPKYVAALHPWAPGSFKWTVREQYDSRVSGTLCRVRWDATRVCSEQKTSVTPTPVGFPPTGFPGVLRATDETYVLENIDRLTANTGEKQVFATWFILCVKKQIEQGYKEEEEKKQRARKRPVSW